MSAMTFAEFQAMGRDVEDLSAIADIAASGIESGAGRTYLDDGLFIERDTLPYWSVTIGNWNGRYSELADAERKLYAFAVSEGYIDAPTPDSGPALHLNGNPWGAKFRCDAERPAQDLADAIGLPQTVFYHPDHAWNCTHAMAKILRDKQTELHVTWLPSNYFEGW
jgi:hypothetical protein